MAIKPRIEFILICVTLVLPHYCPGVYAYSENTDPLPLRRLEAPVKLDGMSDEPAWAAIAPFPMTMHSPTYEGTMTERTEIRVAYDDHYLYVSGRFYDGTPSGIRANSLYRDEANDSDVFTIVLDAFNDNDNARAFWTTPSGVRGDQSIANDSFAPPNSNWNTYWDAATTQNNEGWFAEIRIPFSSLGFQSDRGRVVMGLIVSRLIARKNEEQTYPGIPGEFKTYRPSIARDVLLTGIYTRKPIYITPYALSGLDQTNRLNAAGDAYDLDNNFDQDVGLDLKYNLTSKLTVDATVNTDFAQVEADDQQINLTRFSLFFPEKRQFFQERSGIFDFGMLGADRLFHSRRIGLHQGQAIPIIGGARVTGRVGSWELGVIDMQTASRGVLELPSENFGVLRLRRQVLNSSSNAGGMLTGRFGADGSYNLAYGLDGILRLWGDEYLTLKWAQTFDKDAGQESNSNFGSAGQLYLDWTRRRTKGWTYYQRWVWSGKNYQPEMGFLSRGDYFGGRGLLHLNRFPGAGSAFFRTMPFHIFYDLAVRNSDRKVESFEGNYDLGLWWKSGSLSYSSFAVHYEDLPEELSFSADVSVPAGNYSFVGVSTQYSTPSGQPFQPSINMGVQSFYDGWRYDAGVSLNWRLSRHLGLNATYALNAVRFPDRGQRLDAHIARLRVQSAVNNKMSLNAFIQFNSSADFISTNVRFRYNFAEGNDFWLVYDEGLNTDRHRDDLLLPRTNARAVLLKYTNTLKL